jgi:hypothetical protein
VAKFTWKKYDFFEESGTKRARLEPFFSKQEVLSSEHSITINECFNNYLKWTNKTTFHDS